MGYLSLFLSGLLAVQQVAGVYPTTGAVGSTQQRLEIRTMAAYNWKQYSLYIQALQAMQDDTTSDTGSYYQVMGIHADPNADWDGVSGNGGGTGYCTHNINIFPTWHRPYVALYEQRLSSIAKTLATKYTSDVLQWINASTTLRAPYYDWIIDPASGKSTYPDELALQTVTIQTPSGNKTVSNPLYAYKFPNQVPGFGGPYATFPYTLRWPSSSAQTAQSQPQQVRSQLTSVRSGQKSGVYSFFVQCSDFSTLSNYATRPSNCPTSLEQFHNNYHVWIGGPGDSSNNIPAGHMTIVDYSAFDPIFMLHHCMIDRLFAMWQVVYPNSWVVPTVTNQNTKTIQSGSTQGPSSPLTPFRNSQSQFWTSDAVRAPTTFNYTYPEVKQANGNANTMKAIINSLYGPSSSVTAASTGLSQRSAGLGDIIPSINGIFYEYTADVVTTRYGLGGSYQVLVFLGKPTSSDASTWANDPNLVGSVGIFGSPNIVNNNVISSGSVYLTTALSSKLGALGGLLTSLLPGAAVPYLKDNLSWHVVKDGKEVDVSTIYGFKLTVVGSQRFALSFPTAPEFPRWDSFQSYPDATSGKPGGAGSS